MTVLRQIQVLEVPSGSQILPSISPTSDLACLLMKFIDYRSLSMLSGPRSSILESSFLARPHEDGVQGDPALGEPSAAVLSPTDAAIQVPSLDIGVTWPTPSPSLLKRMHAAGGVAGGPAEDFDFNDMSTPMEAQSEFAWPGEQQATWWQSVQPEAL